jgi:hypothetical protein
LSIVLYMDVEYVKKVIYWSGDIFLPENVKRVLNRDILGSTEKTFYISGWSIIHFISGILFGYLYLYFKYDIRSYALNMLILHTLWEVWQILIGMSKPHKLTGKNNIIDTLVDTLLFMGGAWITFSLK